MPGPGASQGGIETIPEQRDVFRARRIPWLDRRVGGAVLASPGLALFRLSGPAAALTPDLTATGYAPDTRLVPRARGRDPGGWQPGKA